MHPDCQKCQILQANKLLLKHSIKDFIAEDIITRFRLFIDEFKNNLSAPEASCFLNRLIKKAARNNDLYRKEKADYNNLMLSTEKEIIDTINRSENPFQTALRYALAGNIIDFGPPGQFDVFKILSEAASKEPAIDHSNLLQEELLKASTVLYLGDNAGEIVLDKIFIKTINHPNLYFATRGGNVLNDITLTDAEEVGIMRVARTISNGYDAPSTILNRCSPEFRQIFNKADVVVSKGQGNLEGLLNVRDKKIFFLFMVKCNVIGEMVCVDKNNTVVFSNQMIKLSDNKNSTDY